MLNKELLIKNSGMIWLTLVAMLFAGCGQSNGPTAVLKRYVEASKQKDIAAMKESLSAGTVKMVEESAQKQGKTLDELLQQEEGSTIKGEPEIGAEKIEGETATVDVKNPITGDFEKIPFVKEDGKWKLSLDVFIKRIREEIHRQAESSGTIPPPPPVAANANKNANAAPANRKP